MDSPTKQKITDLVQAGNEQEAREKLNEFLSGFDYKGGYREAVDYLDENFAFFLTHVLNMGSPLLDAACTTADVSLPTSEAQADEFRYRFNPTFFALLNKEERAFVMAHETMHILLNHLRLMQRGKKSGKFKDMRKVNIAADCVLNDWLVNMGLDPGRMANYGAFGPKTVGFDCSNATVSEVYQAIPDQKAEDQTGAGDPQDGEGSGDPLDEFMKQAAAAQQGFDNHEWMEKGSASQDESAERISKDTKASGNMPQDLEDKKDDDEAKSRMAGTGFTGMQSWAEQRGVSLAWTELIKEINPDVFRVGGPPPRPSYHRPRRKLQGVNKGRRDSGLEQINLPVITRNIGNTDEIPSIFMALDASGSCAHHINTFITLAKSVPEKKIKLWPVTFTTIVEELDLENPRYRSGGTAFSPIEDYIRSRVVPEWGHYPKSAVIVTDGCASFGGSRPDEKHADRWFWLLTDGGGYAYPDVKQVGRWRKYEDFAKGVTPTKI